MLTRAASTAPDTTVFRNGTVLSVDAAFSEHQALAIRDGKVLALGTEEAVKAAAGRGHRVVDLDGRVVMPGFIEPHMHFVLLAGLGHLRDVGPFQNPTFESALEALSEVAKDAASAGAEEWVMARQFDPIML